MPSHVGFANGSKTFDDATWRSAVAKLIAQTSEVEEEVKVERGGKVSREKVKRTVHETDPTPGQRWSRGMKPPGPLPALVPVEEIASEAKTLRHEGTFVPGEDVDLDCYHNARHFVIEARRHGARSLALCPIRREDGRTVLEVVFVL